MFPALAGIAIAVVEVDPVVGEINIPGAAEAVVRSSKAVATSKVVVSEDEHGGRGRGGRGGRYNNTNTHYVSPDEWSRMSREQRDQVLDSRGTRRNVEEVSVLQQSQPPNIINGGGGNISVVTTETPIASQAGRQFGREAHGGRG